MAKKRMNMDAKMKECMQPHVVMHSLFGLGVGLVLVALIPSLLPMALVVGVIIMVGVFVWDYLR